MNWYSGIDSGSNPPFACPGSGGHYYIGRIGGELTTDYSDFNYTTAAAVENAEWVSAYWDVAGPNSPLRPTGSTPSQWGKLQAEAFITAWSDITQVDGTTLFGDIEPGNKGWATTTQPDNRAVITAFLAEIATSLTPGVYVTADNWGDWFTAGWTCPVPFVLWLANSFAAITSCSDAESEWSTNTPPLGGFQTMIWQYNTHPPSAQDLDITPYSGFLNGHWNPTPVS